MSNTSTINGTTDGGFRDCIPVLTARTGVLVTLGMVELVVDFFAILTYLLTYRLFLARFSYHRMLFFFFLTDFLTGVFTLAGLGDEAGSCWMAVLALQFFFVWNVLLLGSGSVVVFSLFVLWKTSHKDDRRANSRRLEFVLHAFSFGVALFLLLIGAAGGYVFPECNAGFVRCYTYDPPAAEIGLYSLPILIVLVVAIVLAVAVTITFVRVRGAVADSKNNSDYLLYVWFGVSCGFLRVIYPIWNITAVATGDPLSDFQSASLALAIIQSPVMFIMLCVQHGFFKLLMNRMCCGCVFKAKWEEANADRTSTSRQSTARGTTNSKTKSSNSTVPSDGSKDTNSKHSNDSSSA